MSPGESPEKSVILIVDDDATMRFLMRETLEQDGFTVVESADGRRRSRLSRNRGRRC